MIDLEKYRASLFLLRTTFTALGLTISAWSSIATAAVAIAQWGLDCKVLATWLIRSTGMSGSSPCTFTTMDSSFRSNRWITSASRSEPLGWSARVIMTSRLAALQTDSISWASVATIIRFAADCAARSATRTTMGLPPKSASALRSSRDEASRAGITTVNEPIFYFPI